MALHQKPKSSALCSVHTLREKIVLNSKLRYLATSKSTFKLYTTKNCPSKLLLILTPVSFIKLDILNTK